MNQTVQNTVKISQAINSAVQRLLVNVGDPISEAELQKSGLPVPAAIVDYHRLGASFGFVDSAVGDLLEALEMRGFTIFTQTDLKAIESASASAQSAAHGKLQLEGIDTTTHETAEKEAARCRDFARRLLDNFVTLQELKFTPGPVEVDRHAMPADHRQGARNAHSENVRCDEDVRLATLDVSARPLAALIFEGMQRYISASHAQHSTVLAKFFEVARNGEVTFVMLGKEEKMPISPKSEEQKAVYARVMFHVRAECARQGIRAFVKDTPTPNEPGLMLMVQNR